MTADIGNVKIGQAPTGIRPQQSPPTTPQAQPSSPVSSVSIPPAEPASMLRKLIFGGVAAVILFAVIFGVVSLFGGGDSSEATPSPTPSAGASTPVLGKSLSSYFGAPKVTAHLKSDTLARTDFASALTTIAPLAKQATSVAVDINGTPATAAQFLDIMLDGGVPSELATTFASDWTLLAFGQTEAYNASGAADPGTPTATRLALVIELANASKANQALQAWEGAGLASAAAPFLGYDTTLRLVSGFSGGTYRQIAVRYWNFPYADRSIDYGIGLASNGKNYLVLTGSRQSMFFGIDQLMQ